MSVGIFHELSGWLWSPRCQLCKVKVLLCIHGLVTLAVVVLISRWYEISKYFYGCIMFSIHRPLSF